MVETESLQQNLKSGMLKPVIQSGALVSLLVAGGTTLKYILMGGKHPERLLNFAASGIFGEAAYSEGSSMLFVGILMHVLVSVVWSLLFIAFSSQLERFSKDWRVLGMLYGIIVWAGMVFVVMPLSRIGFLEFGVGDALTDIINLILCAGLPIAFLAKKHRFIR